MNRKKMLSKYGRISSVFIFEWSQRNIQGRTPKERIRSGSGPHASEKNVEVFKIVNLSPPVRLVLGANVQSSSVDYCNRFKRHWKQGKNMLTVLVYWYKWRMNCGMFRPRFCAPFPSRCCLKSNSVLSLFGVRSEILALHLVLTHSYFFLLFLLLLLSWEAGCQLGKTKAAVNSRKQLTNEKVVNGENSA